MPLPQLAWDFNGTTTDYVSGSTGTTTGTITYNSSGKYGSSIVIINPPATTANYVDYRDTTLALSGTTGFAISMWVKINGSLDNSLQYIINMTGPGIEREALLIQINNTSNKLGFQCYDNTAVSKSCLSSTTPTIGRWYHTVSVVTGSSLLFYLDGVLASGPILCDTTGKIYGYNSTNNDTFRLGGGILTSSGRALRNGEIDDLRIYNTALTAAQVQSVYNQQGMAGRGVVVSRPVAQRASGSIIGIYSTKITNPSWTGAVMNISRASDGSVTDIYGDFFGNLRLSNGASASSWIGGSQANVLIWYDQSGSGFNATQSTQTTTAGATGRAPQLVADPGGSGQLVIFFPNQNSSNTTSYYGFSMSSQSVASASFRFRISSGKISDSNWESLLCTSSDNQGVRFSGLNLNQGDGNDFLNPGGFATANGTYKTATPFATFLRNTWYNLIASRASGTLSMIHIGHCDAVYFFGGLLSRSFYGYMTDMITYSTQLSPSDYNTINAPYTSPLTGAPLFSQLSSGATSSAVGAFSLRAVNGTTAQAVNVLPNAPLPPAFTAPTGGGPYTQSLTGYAFGASGTYIANNSTTTSQTIYPAWKAFDGDVNTLWYSGAAKYDTSTNNGAYLGAVTTTISGVATPGEWVDVQFPTAVSVYSYSLTRPVSAFSVGIYPKTFKIAGSNDGTTWNLIDAPANQSTYTTGVPVIFTLASPSAVYNRFRMCVSNIIGTTSSFGTGIGQWTLYGSNASWTSDFYADRLGNLLTAPVTGQSLANWLGGATGYVTTWYDQSGAGNNATQATAANQPIIQRATKGPGYSCYFAGAPNQMSFNSATGNIFDNTDFTVCAVTRRSNAYAGTFQYFMGTSPTLSTVPSLKFGYVSDTLVRTQINNIAVDTVNVNVSAYAGASEPTGYNMGMLSQTSGMVAYAWRSGTPTTGTAPLGITPGTLSGPGTLGCSRNSQFFIGEIYEVLIFTRSLYDLDGTSTINQIYNNQLGMYGT